MPSVTLKNVPEDLLGDLREAAETDRRSLNQEILHLLTVALRERHDGPIPPAPEVERQLAAWRKLAGKWESDVDPASEAKQIVRRRSRGRPVDL